MKHPTVEMDIAQWREDVGTAAVWAEAAYPCPVPAQQPSTDTDVYFSNADQVLLRYMLDHLGEQLPSASLREQVPEERHARDTCVRYVQKIKTIPFLASALQIERKSKTHLYTLLPEVVGKHRGEIEALLQSRQSQYTPREQAVIDFLRTHPNIDLTGDELRAQVPGTPTEQRSTIKSLLMKIDFDAEIGGVVARYGANRNQRRYRFIPEADLPARQAQGKEQQFDLADPLVQERLRERAKRLRVMQHSDFVMTEEMQDWFTTIKTRGECNGTNAPFFFPKSGEKDAIKKAKKICADCVVRSECLEFALAGEEKFGVWGGTSENQRRAIRRQRRLEAQTTANDEAA